MPGACVFSCGNKKVNIDMYLSFGDFPVTTFLDVIHSFALDARGKTEKKNITDL